MEILTSRILLRSPDPVRLERFYREQLKLAVAREYPGGVVFHAGTGLIEIPAHLPPEAQDSDAATTDSRRWAALWLQVRDIAAAERELGEAGVPIVREARREPWGLLEMHIDDPDGRLLIIVEIPADHPLRRDVRDHG